jgi:osmotically-inducible protein OsmY
MPTSETGGISPDQLKAQLQQAFQAEPTLSSCNLTQNVTADSIELAGTCPTGKEKQTARRIAQSLAGNRRVVDRITVTGRGEGRENEPPQQQAPPPQF